MKRVSCTLLLLLTAFHLFSQIESGVYKGLERMCNTDKNGKLACYDAPRRWFHVNTLYIEGDSLFLYKEPVKIVKKDTIYSASDGAFYYYVGVVHQADSGLIAKVVKNSCDYCGKQMKRDSATGFMYPVLDSQTWKLIKMRDGLSLNNVHYVRTQDRPLTWTFKRLFYFDSNEIYRDNPPRQYNLISAGIRMFMQTKGVKLDNDTLRVCVERIYDDSLKEEMDTTLLKIDTPGVYIRYYTLDQIKAMVAKLHQPVRFLEVDNIIDYMKAGRVSLTYRISLPSDIHHFREYQMSHLFEFDKVGGEYQLIDNVTENNLELIERE